jgi:serine/threonine-protein kinase
MEVQQQMLGGRYTLLNELGSGGMAVVWRARDEVLGRSVAVKLLAGEYASDPLSRARIRDEARAAATLSHPHIAQVYDFGECDSSGYRVPYVVMELVHGITLQHRVASATLAPRQIFEICGQVAAALAAAHADGLVHRDIKPANVMVTQDGVKVVDFGIAAVAGPADPDDEVLGTPAYLAPERLTGAAVEPASDVYALGVLMYRLLAGESPWAADTTTQMLTAHIYVEPAPLPQLPEVPIQVTALVNRCLRKEPAERPSAAEAATILAGAAVDRTVPVPAMIEPESAKKPRKSLLVGGAAAAVVAAVLVWMLLPISAQGDADVPAAVLPSAPAPVQSRPAVAPTPAATQPGVAAPERTRASPTASPSPSPPAGEPPTGTVEPSPPPSIAPPNSGVRTFTSAGGTIEARCTNAGRARLVAWTPNQPYKVERVSAGPAVAAAIVFKHGNSRIRMTVTCQAGSPSVATTPL